MLHSLIFNNEGPESYLYIAYSYFCTPMWTFLLCTYMEIFFCHVSFSLISLRDYIEVMKMSRFCTRPQLAIECHLLCINSITRKLTSWHLPKLVRHMDTDFEVYYFLIPKKHQVTLPSCLCGKNKIRVWGLDRWVTNLTFVSESSHPPQIILPFYFLECSVKEEMVLSMF